MEEFSDDRISSLETGARVGHGEDEEIRIVTEGSSTQSNLRVTRDRRRVHEARKIHQESFVIWISNVATRQSNPLADARQFRPT